ncbi:FixH family protein [Methylobacterium sp. J-076]|uniref:FixH family protein n=1 Tax=Methylobacterium sp. J-076 TaxID=2836655 RepID=UPI001FB9EBD6|nr:FixH family protein [Methylobacterium sp. J-076]MCJ2012405.1 FixH family protein [Methylobacterium sp. J-076]
MSAPLTGRTILVLLAAFFGTVASADAVLVTSALRTWSGLEEASPYQASQRYNAELDRSRAQDALGWRLAASAARLASEAAITATLSDGEGRALRGRTLRARLERPTDKRFDVGIDLPEVSAGTYAARAGPVARGQWDLVVEVLGEDGVAFRRRHRIILD